MKKNYVQNILQIMQESKTPDCIVGRFSSAVYRDTANNNWVLELNRLFTNTATFPYWLGATRFRFSDTNKQK